MKTARTVAVVLVALSTVPAFADSGPVTHTDQLIVVTPNAPVVIHNGAGTQPPGAAENPPAVAPAAHNGAPQNEPWTEVSHINGTLVKVGEKSDYILRYRKTNISTNPIGWMFGFYGVSISHAVSHNVAIRGDANIVNFEGDSGYEIGASLPIYFRRVYSGPFIEPGFIMRGERNTNYCDASYGSCGSEMSTQAGPEMLFGWHWTFDSGLNIAAAVGAARNLNQRGDGYSSGEDVMPAGYFRIGYAF